MSMKIRNGKLICNNKKYWVKIDYAKVSSWIEERENHAYNQILKDLKIQKINFGE